MRPWNAEQRAALARARKAIRWLRKRVDRRKK